MYHIMYLRTIYIMHYVGWEEERRYLWQEIVPQLQALCTPNAIDVVLCDVQLARHHDYVLDRRSFDLHLRQIQACAKESIGPFFIVS